MITIELPWPDSDLSPNSRVHHMVKYRLSVKAKEDGYWCAVGLADQMKSVNGGLRADFVFHPPDRRKRDLDNLISSEKHYIDGVCEYFDIDDSAIKKVSGECGDVHPGAPNAMNVWSAPRCSPDSDGRGRCGAVAAHRRYAGGCVRRWPADSVR